jgi:hypothetical protein
MSLLLSVRMGQLGSHGTDFHEIWYLSIFLKSLRKIQVTFKSDKNNSGNVQEDRYSFLTICRSFLLSMNNITDKICTENQNTYFVSNIFFSKIMMFMGVWKIIV